MMNIRKKILLFLIIFFTAFFVYSDDGKLRAAAVQFQVRKEIFQSEKIFYKTIDELLSDYSMQCRPDLVVFPEYTSVFLSLVDYYLLLENAGTFLEGFAYIKAIHPSLASLKDFFLLTGEESIKRMDRLWGSLAKKYGVYLCGGSIFAVEKDDQGEETLVNRLILYDDMGRRMYHQDKVFLTPFEKDLLELSPGRIAEAKPVNIKGCKVVFTLCRDTFFEEWEDHFACADLWFDCKANGASYDQSQKENFQAALPERISRGTVAQGCTVCLTGRFLDLFWEGESSYIKKTGNSYIIIEKTSTYTDQEVLCFTAVSRE